MNAFGGTIRTSIIIIKIQLLRTLNLARLYAAGIPRRKPRNTETNVTMRELKMAPFARGSVKNRTQFEAVGGLGIHIGGIAICCPRIFKDPVTSQNKGK
jgi:hypothetical protein